MQITIEIKKHENKDYTMHIYEGMNYLQPTLSIKKPMHWNKLLTTLAQYLRAKGMINVFQKKEAEKKLVEPEGEKQC
jgi:hypothetical protein